MSDSLFGMFHIGYYGFRIIENILPSLERETFLPSFSNNLQPSSYSKFLILADAVGCDTFKASAALEKFLWVITEKKCL